MVGRIGLDTIGRHGEQSVSLIYNDKKFIFVHDAQTRVAKLLIPSCKIDRYFISRMQRSIEFCRRGIIHRNLTMGKIRLDRCFTSIGKCFQQKFEQRHILLHFKYLYLIGPTTASPIFFLHINTFYAKAKQAAKQNVIAL